MTAQSKERARGTRQTDAAETRRRGGFVSEPLPLGGGRYQLKRASRREGVGKGVRDSYSTLEVLEAPSEGWLRYVVRHYGPGRYKLVETSGERREQHLEVPDELAQRIEQRMKDAPPPPVVVPPAPAETAGSAELTARLSDLELAIHRVGDLVDTLAGRIDELAAAVDAATSDDGDEDEDEPAQNPPAGDLVRQVNELRELNATLNGTFGGPEPKLDISAVLRMGMEAFMARQAAAANAAPNPPASSMDPRWAQLIATAERVGVTPDMAQAALASGLRTPPTPDAR